MRWLRLGKALPALLAIALTGCGPSQEQTECEEAGGKWKTKHRYEYAYVVSRGSYEPVLVTTHYCDF